MDLINAALVAAALGFALWGLRQHALLRRIHAGLSAMRDGKQEIRVRRGPEDTESVLTLFDQVASRRTSGTSSMDLGLMLGKLCDVLRPSLLAIQNHVHHLSNEPTARSDPDRDCLSNLQTSIDGLVRLLAAPQNLSAVREGVQSLQAGMSTVLSREPTATVVVVDDESSSHWLTSGMAGGNWRVLVVPAIEAAAVLVHAVRPALVQIHITRADGLGVRTLVRLAAHRGGVFNTWLYGTDQEAGWCLPLSQCWLWPAVLRESSTRDRVAHVAGWRWSGNADLASDVQHQLGLAPFAHDDAGTPLSCPRSACLIRPMADAAESRESGELILILPDALARNEPDRLIDEFRGCAFPTTSLTELADSLRPRLIALTPAARDGASELVANDEVP